MDKTLSSADITGVILAGGRGSRMGGQDKGLMAFNGRPLVEHLLEALKAQTGAQLINANRNHDLYERYGVPVMHDELTGFQGPLAGFAAAMQKADTAYIMTVPCDGPQIAPDMAERLLQALRQEDAELAVAHDGERLQPVHALVPVRLLPSLLEFLMRGDRKIDLWYAQHRMATADFSDSREVFRNINTPEQKVELEQDTSPNRPAASARRLAPLSGEGQEKLPPTSGRGAEGEGSSFPILGVSAWSGSGKTTLLTELIPRLKSAGLRLTVIKHGHHNIELDKPGKDTYRFREAGADQVLLASRKRMAIMQECKTQREPELVDVLRFVNPDCADLVLVEGFKHTAIPKIEVHRPALGKPLLYPQDQSVIALATDDLSLETPSHIPKFDLNEPDQLAEFILDWVKEKKPPPNCADHRDPASLTVEEARSRIMDTLQAVEPVLKRSLRDALGQVLAEDVISPIDVPNHTNEVGAEGCVRIGSGHRAGQNVRQAGGDIAEGSVVLTAGRRVNPADLGVLASLGVSEIGVHRPLRVAFFSTGDGLRSIGEALHDGEVYDSNRYALYGMLKQLNVEIFDMGVVRDDPVAMEAAFLQASAVADVVITSGGVSVGEADYTKVILDKLGQINVWKIAIKPGGVLAFGKLGDTLFFGLPGNPVAVMVTFLQFVQPALLKLAGQQDNEPLLVDAVCQSRLKKKPGHTEFQHGTVRRTADGKLVVEKSGYQGSGVLASMSKGNCLIILPQEAATVEPGDMVQVQPFGW